MKQPVKDNIFNIGETVVAKVNTKVKLIIDDYKDRIYYCKISSDPNHKQLVYFERELIPDNDKVYTLVKDKKPLRLFGGTTHFK